MFNRVRTFEVFGYDLDLSTRRRTNAEVVATGGLNKKTLKVIDNCPSCDAERQITLRASRKNKKCYKCFHSSPEMILAKQNQNKIKSKETKDKMKANHWSKTGHPVPFKGQQHTNEVKARLSVSTKNLMADLSPEEKITRSIKSSCALRGIPIEDFDGWITSDNLRLRGTQEYRVFEKEVRQRDKHCHFPRNLSGSTRLP